MTSTFLRTVLAAAALFAASQARAAIQASAIPVPINPTLAAAGWEGYYIVLVADAASQKIVTVDLKNNPLGLPGPMGISGKLHQRWMTSFEDNSLIPTPSTPARDLESTSVALRRDSLFLNSSYYNVAVPDAFAEDNNLRNGPVYDHSGSPLIDLPAVPNLEANGADYGVGSLMTFSGAATLHSATSFLYLAFIIVPAGGDGWGVGYNPHAWANVRGVALDPFSVNPSTAYAIELSYPAPEPGSLALLATGGLALLARRRHGKR